MTAARRSTWFVVVLALAGFVAFALYASGGCKAVGIDADRTETQNTKQNPDTTQTAGDDSTVVNVSLQWVMGNKGGVASGVLMICVGVGGWRYRRVAQALVRVLWAIEQNDAKSVKLSVRAFGGLPLAKPDAVEGLIASQVHRRGWVKGPRKPRENDANV